MRCFPEAGDGAGQLGLALQAVSLCVSVPAVRAGIGQGSGRRLALVQIPATSAGNAQVLGWARAAAGGGRVAWAIEGTRSYGAGLASYLTAEGERMPTVTARARATARPRDQTEGPALPPGRKQGPRPIRPRCDRRPGRPHTPRPLRSRSPPPCAVTAASFTRSGRRNSTQNPMRWKLTVNEVCLWEDSEISGDHAQAGDDRRRSRGRSAGLVLGPAEGSSLDQRTEALLRMVRGS